MESVIAKLIEQLNSSVFVLLAILGVIFWTLYKIGSWKEIFKQHSDKIVKIQDLSDKLIALAVKVDLIYENTNPRKTVEARSPIALTASGKEIAANLEAEKLLKKYIRKLEAAGDFKDVNDAYDIQSSAMKIAKEKMITFLDEDELALVKKEAYSRGIILEDVMAVFGVLLRNHVLEEKKIPVSDVDEHEKRKTQREAGR